MEQVWPKSIDIQIPANTLIGKNHLYPGKGFFIHSGIIREFFVDDNGIDHTLRFVQGPIFISPDLNDSFRKGQTSLQTQALTRIEGRAWDLDYIISLSSSNASFFRSMMAILLDALVVKAHKDIRRHECTAAERYLLFLEEFPGVVNQVPLKHVASYLNMTPETISRIRNELSQKSSNAST